MNARVAVPSAVAASLWLSFAGGIPRTPAGICAAIVAGMLAGAVLGGGVAWVRSRGGAR